ncbi:MAG TPA: type III-B CRISPR module RAMP protein Cmr1, partial [Thermoanaerobaculia bacterium]
EDRRYRFLTYVFGGGVKVREHEKPFDAVTPIRVASVRGQLRFWWRACNPGRCRTVEELRQREGEIWGTMSQASKVEAAVLSQPSAPRNVEVFAYELKNGKKILVVQKGMREIAYGAFPLQPSREAQRSGAQPWVLYDYGSSIFTLRFTYPKELRADVEAALWAWETFGGLGGRTRRGFGAILREGASGISAAEAGLSKYRENPHIAGAPSLHQARFATGSKPHSSALEAWKDCLGLLQMMRQGRGFGRNDPPAGSRKPAGRSRWPEPDEIRNLTGKTAPAHKNPVVTVPRFPRAAFGMPIVFHFHPGSPAEPGSMGDPDMKPLQLQPVGFDRLASPLIVRPLADGKSFRAAALVLSSEVPASELHAGKKVHPVNTTLDATLARQIPALNRNGRTYTDPIDLFLEELKR